MRITDVKIILVNEDRLKAYVTITIEECFVVRDLKIISGNDGLFVAMPSKKKKDNTFRDIAHPLIRKPATLSKKPSLTPTNAKPSLSGKQPLPLMMTEITSAAEVKGSLLPRWQ